MPPPQDSNESPFAKRQNGRIVMHRDLRADIETPLSAYWKLSHDELHSFLLESVTGGEQLARYSILGVRPRMVLRSHGRSLRKCALGSKTVAEIPIGSDPLDILKQELGPPNPLPEGMPKFCGGAVGVFGYDLVRFFERLNHRPADDLNFDEMAVMLCDSVVVFDHAKNLLRIIVHTEPTAQGRSAANQEIDRIAERLSLALPALPGGRHTCGEVSSNIEPKDFESGVATIIEYLARGDGIQAVLSQRFEASCEAHPLSVYRALRSLNPSPYMFMYRFGDFDLVGASPELLVSLEARTARVRPIAGTRPRGASMEEDALLAKELLADEKERAEHVMLVDLGRNDLGKVCEYGSVQVNELMTVERYSHVMHIVSDVTGRLRPELDAFDLIRATFPAGTVSGAPKVRAMQIIDELEPTSRGPYAGAAGYVGSQGDMDLAITIRSILMKGGKAYVQAGAGIVYDSVPERELQETRDKAGAALKALKIAASGLEFEA